MKFLSSVYNININFLQVIFQTKKLNLSYFFVTINFIAVLSSPLIITSLKAGITTKLSPLGATNPRAMAIPLIAWLREPAPIVWIYTLPFSLKIFAIAPATLLGFDLLDTFNISIYLIPQLSN